MHIKFVGKPCTEEVSWKAKIRGENNIKMDRIVIGYEAVDWIYLTQKRVQWKSLVNMVIYSLVP
jgi:hypothetical protein